MKRKSSRRRKDPLAYAGDTPAGREIISALADLHNTLKRGIPLKDRYVVNVHEVTIPAPRAYNAVAVREIRHKLGVSQAVFAQLVGASLILIQSWEQGKRFPDTMACRLLDEINHDPRRWTRMIRTAA